LICRINTLITFKNYKNTNHNKQRKRFDLTGSSSVQNIRKYKD